MSVTTPFEPARHLTRISGSDYLEVKWRLVWMRDQHPDATIETQLVSHNDNTAVFRALVSIPGGGSATGWGPSPGPTCSDSCVGMAGWGKGVVERRRS